MQYFTNIFLRVILNLVILSMLYLHKSWNLKKLFFWENYYICVWWWRRHFVSSTWRDKNLQWTGLTVSQWSVQQTEIWNEKKNLVGQISVSVCVYEHSMQIAFDLPNWKKTTWNLKLPIQFLVKQFIRFSGSYCREWLMQWGLF